MSQTHADRLMHDPRVAQAKRALLAALREHQAALEGARPAEPGLRAAYEAQLDAFSQTRGGPLFYPYLASGLGRGALVELADGSVKYDLITGIGVHGLGHSDETIVAACLDAALRDTVMQGNLMQHADSAHLAERFVALARESGAPLNHCFLTSSGAMANENALKLAFHKHRPADRLLAFDHCFMGRTLALAQVTDRPAYRAGLPTTVAVDYVPFFDFRDPAGSTERAVAALRRHLARYPGKHVAMCMELVQGEGGFNVGDAAFFHALIEVLEAHGVAVLVDEVQTFGRTTRPFAFQHFGLDAHVDIVTIGKITQTCATLFTDTYVPPAGLVSQTFTAATSAIAAAEVTLDRLAADAFGEAGRNAQIHHRVMDHLRAIAERHPDALHDPHGLGGMIAFQIFDGGRDTARRFLHALFDAGVIAFFTGADPVRIRLLPPIGAITDAQIDDACAVLERTLSAMAAEM
ncbi:MAG: aminotransferase class III-fold pyridoxal phosphate-dependent enzyme [Phycisphaeraceae bacterium]